MVGDSASVKVKVMRLQVVAITTLRVLVTSSEATNNKSSSKRNLANLVAKKLLHSSNENCLDILHQFLHHKTSSLLVLGLLAGLCVVSRDFSQHLTRQSKWIVSLTKYLTSCSGKAADCEHTCCVLQILCSMVSNGEGIPTE